jgi:hypothetical protein
MFLSTIFIDFSSLSSNSQPPGEFPVFGISSFLHVTIVAGIERAYTITAYRWNTGTPSPYPLFVGAVSERVY